MTQLRRSARAFVIVAATLAVLVTRAHAIVPPFTQCPAMDGDTGCQLLIVASANGAFVVLFDPAQPPINGDETLVGLQNDSSQTINSLTLSSFTDIFGFEGDGLCTVFNAPLGCPFGPTTYEGPGTSFGNISPFADSGTVTFTPGVPPGGSAYFSLEEDVQTVSVSVCGNGVLEPGEQCDDGPANGSSTSCCTATCTPFCDDGNDCTTDSCDASGGTPVCSYMNNVGPCATGNRCLFGETCSGGVCGGGFTVDCNDFNPCTDDFCSSATGCFTVANNDPCDDFNPCTDNDFCQFGFCNQGTFNNNPCNDGNACTLNDRCSFGSCFGTPIICGSDQCRSGFCDFFLGCQFFDQPDGLHCDDHNPCTTDDACHSGSCTGDARNCFDDDPCTVDSCNSAGGAFLCGHEDCHNVPGSSCPAQCTPVLCGNGRLDPGETCDPPDPTLDPARPGEAKCRPDCTYCGDGQVQTNHGESCDDGNLLSGCNPSRPTIPLDACQNACTGPICHDPSNIKMKAGQGIFTMHGRLTPLPPDTAIDPRDQTFVVELTDLAGTVLFRSSLEAGSITPKGTGFAYFDSTAAQSSGIGKLKIQRHGGGYVVTVWAYGDLSKATSEMTTHVFVGAREWTLSARWKQTSRGWKLDTSATFVG